jgi:hypothetical protein
MKKGLLIFLLMLIVTPSFAFTESFGPEYDRIVEIFQSEDEPDAMDAVWESKSLLKVGVFKHDKNYDSYANHACEVVQSHGFQGNRVAVQIIDLKKLAEAEEWVILGQAQCH